MSSTSGHVWTAPGMPPHCDTSPAVVCANAGSGGEVGGAPDVSSLLCSHLFPFNSTVWTKFPPPFHSRTPLHKELHCNKWAIMKVNMWIYDVGCSLPVWSICAVRAAVVSEVKLKTSSSDSFLPSDKTLRSSLHVKPTLCDSTPKRGQSCRTHSRKVLSIPSNWVSSQQVSCATRSVRSAEQCWGTAE